ncbi:MAG: DUF2868 domain-containing protein [Desulfatiglans sp.]|nr:DUF2868 domain-containing protein [Desulfatiglans sp.]
MKLSEIINIEYQLYRDAQSGMADVQERDRKIGMSFTGPIEDRAAMFRFWLKNLMDKEVFPGSWFDSILTFLRYLIFFFFLISGAFTCAGILAYDGSQPVNIVNFIAVFAGLNILLYLLFILNLLPGSYRKRIPLIGDFYRLAGFLLRRIIVAAGRRLYKNRTKSIRFVSGIFHRIESRHIIYKNIERWLLFSITQLGGFAFSLGAFISSIYLITFSDIAFAWNTTLDVSPQFFHRVIQIISAPWSIFNADIIPTLSLIESTRYFRLDGAYSGTQGNALTAGGWWHFLLCIIIFYGLIPRAILMTVSNIRLHLLTRKAPLLSAELDSLYRRLTSPVYLSQSVESMPIVKRNERAQSAVFDSKEINAQSCMVIVWGEAEMEDAQIKRIISSQFRWNTHDIVHAGGLDNLQDEELLNDFEKGAQTEPILFMAESWEAPGRAVKYFLKHLRTKIQKERRIIIGLINLDHEKRLIAPALADWQNWHEAVARLNDPFIVIEPVTEAQK